MLVSSFFLKIITKPKKIYSSCRASKWQFPLALTELPLVNTSGRVQFSSPGKVTDSQLDTTNESQEVSPFPTFTISNQKKESISA